jgi:hypothetical protein
MGTANVFVNGFIRASKSKVMHLMAQKDFVSLVLRLIDIALMWCGIKVEVFVLKDGMDIFLPVNTSFVVSSEGMLDR